MVIEFDVLVPLTVSVAGSAYVSLPHVAELAVTVRFAKERSQETLIGDDRLN
jgi:hypothetical protein